MAQWSVARNEGHMRGMQQQQLQQPAQSAGHVTKGQCVNVLSEATIR